MAWVLQGQSIVEVAIRGTLFGQRTLSLFHYRYNTNVNAANGFPIIDLLATILNDAGGLVENYAACCSQNLTIDFLSIQKVHPAPRIRRYNFDPSAPTGTNIAACLSPNHACAITRQADEATRHGTGTLHMPAVPVTFMEDGLITGAADAAYTTLAEEMLVHQDGGLWVPVLYNRVAPADSLNITRTTVQNTLRVQRRRTVGLGE